ncbi:MAG: threonine--tRNA ligase [Nitrospirae bacterium]|nr:threonine--tRNA ligase [Nitrospirota bacterium]
MITITLPDGTKREAEKGITVLAFAASIGKGLAKAALAGEVDGKLVDLGTKLEADAVVKIHTFDSPEGKETYRHSASHIMAQAVKQLFPNAKVTIGPSIEDGFYYDFDMEQGFTPEDLEAIEKKMAEIIKANTPFVRSEMSSADAVKLFTEMGETYKAEIISDLGEPVVSLYDQGGFKDLCRGPHVPSTGYIKAYKLLNSAGAYWRGDEKNKMLQRIYGTAWATKDELKAYLDKLEEIKRRDHRKLGRELELFSHEDSTGAGLILWHPKGAIIRRTIEDFWKAEHVKGGYELVYTPHIAKLDLWKQSGHWDFYRDSMYAPMEIDEVQYELKPMNCPFHIAIYKTKKRSYRELPIRWAELGTVYRYERSGALHGLMRVRGFTQDDAHIFCRPDQIEGEIFRVLDFTLFVLKTFGFTEYDIYLSTQPEKSVGTQANWDIATGALKSALEKRGLAYTVDPGEGVFYGPKIDIKIKDVLGRSWQCTTVQVDFNLPERFGVEYTGEDGAAHQPIMVHRALMGSLERFFGVLVEHYAGIFPVWLAPVQAMICTITERQADYALKVAADMRAAGMRVEADIRNDKIGYKIREATLQKVPYILVVGDKEVESGAVAVRMRDGKDLGAMPVGEFSAKMAEEIANRTIA